MVDPERWSRFLRQVAKVDSMTRRKIHLEDAQTFTAECKANAALEAI